MRKAALQPRFFHRNCGFPRMRIHRAALPLSWQMPDFFKQRRELAGLTRPAPSFID
jgi:hypothetical protein